MLPLSLASRSENKKDQLHAHSTDLPLKPERIPEVPPQRLHERLSFNRSTQV